MLAKAKAYSERRVEEPDSVGQRFLVAPGLWQLPGGVSQEGPHPERRSSRKTEKQHQEQTPRVPLCLERDMRELVCSGEGSFTGELALTAES